MSTASTAPDAVGTDPPIPSTDPRIPSTDPDDPESSARAVMVANLALWREFVARSWRSSPALMITVLTCLGLNSISFALVGLCLSLDPPVHSCWSLC